MIQVEARVRVPAEAITYFLLESPTDNDLHLLSLDGVSPEQADLVCLASYILAVGFDTRWH